MCCLVSFVQCYNGHTEAVQVLLSFVSNLDTEDSRGKALYRIFVRAELSVDL